MKNSLQKKLLALLFIAILLPSALQAGTYPVLVAKVPFKFSMGKRVFNPGEYHFAVIGVGLLAVLDSHKHLLGVFLTRSAQTPSPGKSGQLFFQKGKQQAELTRISLDGNEQEILGEEPAGHQNRKESIPVETFSDTGNIVVPRAPRKDLR